MRGFYKHKKAMDLCIEVIKVRYRDSKRIKVKVRWWNLGYTGNPWPLMIENIEINPSQLADWLPIEI